MSHAHLFPAGVDEGRPPEPPHDRDPLCGFRLRYKRGAYRDAEAIEVRAVDLARSWHRLVTRITVLHQARFRAVAARLADGYEATDCLDAIETYGRDKWHRDQVQAGHPAWLDLEDFFAVKVLERWIQTAKEQSAAMAHAKVKQEVRRPVAPAVQGLVKPVAEALRMPTPADAIQADLDRFHALPHAERVRRTNQATNELATLRPGMKQTVYQVQQQVLVILRREAASQRVNQ